MGDKSSLAALGFRPSALGMALGLDAADLDTRLRALGATLGPPWNEDYRLAAQAAWLCL
ncbi:MULTISPECIES: hypothetical protein [unclassified Caulobacter]|uniref:hypothetical protein n=1 Tax=unclassified Caulobacter TaxID=2648921 RepID=UPI000A4397ED|nr:MULTISPECIES: hypothetical protein [unclassified Caulobacter]